MYFRNALCTSSSPQKHGEPYASESDSFDINFGSPMGGLSLFSICIHSSEFSKLFLFLKFMSLARSRFHDMH